MADHDHMTLEEFATKWRPRISLRRDVCVHYLAWCLMYSGSSPSSPKLKLTTARLREACTDYLHRVRSDEKEPQVLARAAYLLKSVFGVEDATEALAWKPMSPPEGVTHRSKNPLLGLALRYCRDGEEEAARRAEDAAKGAMDVAASAHEKARDAWLKARDKVDGVRKHFTATALRALGLPEPAWDSDEAFAYEDEGDVYLVVRPKREGPK